MCMLHNQILAQHKAMMQPVSGSGSSSVRTQWHSDIKLDRHVACQYISILYLYT